MPAEPLEAGARIGRYEVIAHLASGGMGQVYKATDVELERVVALKVLPAHVAGNPVMVERFRREARSAAALSHRNIVTLYDWGQDAGIWFLALEFIDGTDLSRHIAERGRLDAEEAWRITVQAVRALDHAYRQGIVHRDIKPSNFLLARHGRKFRVKMTDFGLARADNEDDYRVTRDGTTVGTLDYMSPEQARDSASADVRSDVYSLGCTLYHMLAGRPPFAEGGLGERVYRHQNVDPDDVREHNPGVPDGLWEVLRRMLAKRPEDRYQTPAELLDTLLALGVPTSESSDTLPADESSAAQSTLPAQLAPPTADSLHITSAEVEGVTAEDRRAAAEAARRAGAMMDDETQQAEACEILLGCCRLDPACIGYRRALRRLIRQLHRRGELPPVPANARGRLEAAQAAGDHRRVLECGEEVLAESPEDIATHLALVEAATELSLPDLDAWLLKQACKHHPANTDLRRSLARAYERVKDIAKAITVWREIRKAHPGDAEAATRIEALLRLLARAYERQNDRDSAVAVWEAVMKLRPQDEEAQGRICDLLLGSDGDHANMLPSESV